MFKCIKEFDTHLSSVFVKCVLINNETFLPILKYYDDKNNIKLIDFENCNTRLKQKHNKYLN